MMTLDEAYSRLSLKPLDEYIHQQEAHNRATLGEAPIHPSNAMVQHLYQGIGATTWMLVSAALKMAKFDVLIVAHENKLQRVLRELK